jgi:hypothetical protein
VTKPRDLPLRDRLQELNPHVPLVFSWVALAAGAFAIAALVLGGWNWSFALMLVSDLALGAAAIGLYRYLRRAE